MWLHSTHTFLFLFNLYISCESFRTFDKSIPVIKTLLCVVCHKSTRASRVNIKKVEHLRLGRLLWHRKVLLLLKQYPIVGQLSLERVSAAYKMVFNEPTVGAATLNIDASSNIT